MSYCTHLHGAIAVSGVSWEKAEAIKSALHGVRARGDSKLGLESKEHV